MNDVTSTRSFKTGNDEPKFVVLFGILAALGVFLDLRVNRGHDFEEALHINICMYMYENRSDKIPQRDVTNSRPDVKGKFRHLLSN